jgi:cysteine desulfurase
VIAAIPPIMEKLRKLSPYWGENGPLENADQAFNPVYA